MEREEKEEKEDEKSCVVCTERYTKLLRKRIECNYCHRAACLDCQKGYLTSSAHDPHCMFCKVGWNEDFIRTNFTNNWLTKEYSKVELECLWQREKSLLPECMLEVERTKIQEQFFDRSNIAQLSGDVRYLVHILRRLDDELSKRYQRTIDFREIIRRLQQWKTSNHNLRLSSDVFDLDRLSELFEVEKTNKKEEEKEQKRAFIKPCPAEDCRGFLSSQYVCGLCHTKVCPTCFVIKRLRSEDEAPHTCKKEDVLTAEMIRKETKNCPKCGTSITKIEGCDQMFCTHCNTPFSWRTLEIINGHIHNPHYFQWVNRNNNQQQQRVQQPMLPCNADEMPDTWTFSNVIRNHFSRGSTDNIQNFIRIALHIRGTQRRHHFNEDEARLNRNLRIQFLLGNITEEKFKQQCYMRWKQNKFTQQKQQIIETLYVASANIIRQLMTSVEGWNSNTDPIEKDKALRSCFTGLSEIALFYSTSIYGLYERYKSDSAFDIIVVHLPFGNVISRTTTRKNKLAELTSI